jgi:hypothetical protein
MNKNSGGLFILFRIFTGKLTSFNSFNLGKYEFRVMYSDLSKSLLNKVPNSRLSRFGQLYTTSKTLYVIKLALIFTIL